MATPTNEQIDQQLNSELAETGARPLSDDELGDVAGGQKVTDPKHNTVKKPHHIMGRL